MATIKEKIKAEISRLIPDSIKLFLFQDFYAQSYHQFVNLSFSQEGEDLLLDRFLKNKKKGFYVDIGAHHPMRFSNTYRFYLRGWSGINIDAMPNSMQLFHELRPRDINIETPISNVEKKIDYYVFSDTAFNTLSKDIADKHIVENGAVLVEKMELYTQTLSNILDKFLPKDVTIDFMSIDIEGLELNALRSNNWLKYKPLIISVEMLAKTISEIQNLELNLFLKKEGYELIGKTCNTLFYQLYSKRAN